MVEKYSLPYISSTNYFRPHFSPGSTQPLTEMSTWNILGVKAAGA